VLFWPWEDAGVTVFFTSDTHFGDPRALRIDRRPFASLAEHDAALLQRWNDVVRPTDFVWHLGDFAFDLPAGRIAELLTHLNGTKALIIGNNDRPATLQASGWESVQHYAETVVDGTALVLCHYPFRTWNGMGRGRVDLHGHSHGKLKPQTRQYDVGVDVFDYRPVTLDRILSFRRRGSSAK
jgi:calcineurin-like phosphoesterase family protein